MCIGRQSGEKKSKLIDLAKSFVMILKEEGGGGGEILITRLNRARDRKNYFGKSTSSIIPRDYSVKPSGTTSTSTFNVPSIIAQRLELKCQRCRLERGRDRVCHPACFSPPNFRINQRRDEGHVRFV